MSDQDGDDPETGAGGGGNTPATDPNNNSDVGNDPTTPHMGDRSDGGEFESPNTEGDTGRARVPSERVLAGSEDDISEQDPTERPQLTAEEIQTQEVSKAPASASKLQDDVEGVNAASAKERPTVKEVPVMPIQVARGTVQERHDDYDDLRSPEPEREYKEQQEPEPETEAEPDAIVVNEQPGMQTPNTGIQMEYSTDHVFQGDTRRSTINGIMDMLGTRSELEERLKTIQASPVRVVTKEAAEQASMDILYKYTKENEAHIEQLKHRLAKAEAQNVVAKAQSAHETMEVQERQQFSNAQVQSMEDSLETTHRELAYIHSQEDERRSKAAEMSKTMNIACRHFKNPNASERELEEVGKFFKEPIETLTDKDVSLNIMGMDIPLHIADLGETVKALGGDDFLMKIQQKFEDAGKPLCDDLEELLKGQMYPLIPTLHLKDEEEKLVQTLCKKAAYTIEIFCWQNVRNIIADEIRPLIDTHIDKLLEAAKMTLEIDLEPEFMRTLKDVVSQYDDLLTRMQRSGLTCASLTREESALQDQIEDLQGNDPETMRKYPTKEARNKRLAELDKEVGVIQDRRDKLMKSMKAREAQVALLFSDNYFIKSEWSAKTITSNPLKPMSTLDISGGGNPNIEQAELFMSVVWALLTAYPKQFSVLIPVFYAMREQFLLEEITWLPPINDKPETFSEYGMTSEYQKMYLIQDRLLGDMIRVVCPEQSWGRNKSE